MREWRCTFFVATRFNSMQERTRRYGPSLSRQEVERKVASHIRQLTTKGVAVYPGYDIKQELVA